MHLIVFCDGTWNTPDQLDEGIPAPTNVVKLRNALASVDQTGLEQRCYYHSGVGTNGGWWDRVIGGGIGDGLDKNIMSAYCWLARNYQHQAKIWLFGFSRGAYTVRSLGGMIARCGLLDTTGMTDEAIWSTVEALYANYRQKESTTNAVMATKSRPFHEVAIGKPCKYSIPIRFIGVWDTVGALGVPDDMALLNLIDNPTKHSFHDTNLSPVVQSARHAIAIDERRQSFVPTLWTNVASDLDVKQRWFPGVHCDVGGGYAQCGLSDGALLWMMDEVENSGLAFRLNVRQQLTPDPQGQLHDSVTGVFKALKTRPRNVPLFIETSALLDHSAIERHLNPPLSQGEYWPTQVLGKKQSALVDIYARELWNFTGIYLEAGVTYEFSATGEWMDSSITSGPKGTNDGKFQIGEVVQMVSSAWGKGEALYSKLTGNHQIDFWYTRREEQADWFALIGLVANDVLSPAGADKKQIYLPHEVLVIGAKKKFQPTASDYLYCFANDAWQAYGNNRGSVQLKIVRQ